MNCNNMEGDIFFFCEIITHTATIFKIKNGL